MEHRRNLTYNSAKLNKRHLQHTPIKNKHFHILYDKVIVNHLGFCTFSSFVFANFYSIPIVQSVLSTMPAPENTLNNNPEQIQEQPVRELSQTDLINKKLLTSLFKRLDEGGDSQLAKMLEADNNGEIADEEWKD